MNIFYLEKDPMDCAKAHCDQDVKKLIPQYTRLLFNGYYGWLEEENPGHPIFDNVPIYGRGWKPYKTLHPTSLWVRETKENWEWTMFLTFYLCGQYWQRFGHDKHECFEITLWMMEKPPSLPSKGITKRPQVMPKESQIKNKPLKAYRRFYFRNRRKKAKWDKLNNKPGWFQKLEEKFA